MFALLATGCQQNGTRGTPRERASGYWQLKQSKQWEEMYDRFLDPEIKTTLSKEAFLKKRRLAFDILSFTITEVTEEGDPGCTASVATADARAASTSATSRPSPCGATVRAEAEANIPLRLPSGGVQLRQQHISVADQWVRRDGIWYVRLSE